jgi:hypothetical protein
MLNEPGHAGIQERPCYDQSCQIGATCARLFQHKVFLQMYMRSIRLLFVISVAASSQVYSRVQTFGMVGIASGQTARLNVLNVGGQGQAEQCLTSLIFVDDQSAVLKTSTVAVQPGQSVFLDLAADADLGVRTNERRQIRAIFAQIPAVAPPRAQPACVLVPTLEIFDPSTARTSILYVNTTPIPQPSAPVTQP